MNDRGVENLINAIVLRAVFDYRDARHGRFVGRKSLDVVIWDCERFFRSDWFRWITKLDGEALLEKLQKED